MTPYGDSGPKIVLINPPLTPRQQAGSLKDVANIIPPLGIGYIAAVLEQHDLNVSIIDCVPLQVGFDELKAMLSAAKPDILGFTATILSINNAIAAAEQLREFLPDTLFVIGGPHFSTLPKDVMEISCFDIGVIGEGEFTMLELAEQMREGNLKLDSIQSLVYRDGDEVIVNERRPYIRNLDELPFPARHLYPPLDRYRPIPASYKKLPFGHMITSRGCPYQCIFCDRTVFGNRFRARSAQNVVDEMEELINVYGAREIKFFDDIPTMREDRMIEICDEMISRGIEVPWSCTTRVDRVSKELLNKMKEAGCWQIVFGLESGSQEILDIMKKGTTLEQNRRAVAWAKEAGMNVRAFFVLGMPGETLETIDESVQFAIDLDLDVPTFYVLALYPGNELYKIAQREGKVLHHDFGQYTSIIDVEKTRLSYVPEGMTEQELRDAIAAAYRKFYLRPKYILRQFLSIRGLQDVARYWRGFKTVVSMR